MNSVAAPPWRRLRTYNKGLPPSVNPVSHEPPISLDRFNWIQDFATRLAELGAPSSAEERWKLGQELHETSSGMDPQAVAEVVWERWPTDHGALDLGSE